MKTRSILWACSSLCFLLAGCQADQNGFYTNLEDSTKEGYLYHHVYKVVKTESLFKIHPLKRSIFGTSYYRETYGMLTEFPYKEGFPAFRKELQDNPEERKQYMIVEHGTLFQVMEMKIYWLSPSGISHIYAEVLNGPLKGKIIDVSIFGRSRYQKDDSRILYTDIVEDIGQLSNEELKKKGLLTE